jgi:hypothetical protein
MESLAANASIPGDSSSAAPNSDRKPGGIRCRRPKELIVVEKVFVNALKIANKDANPKNLFSEAEVRHPNCYRTQKGSRF